MNVHRVLGCVVLGLASYCTALTAEPTSLAQVKTIAIRDGAPTAESTICLSQFEDRLVAGGFTLAAPDSADAEMTVTLSVGGGRVFGGGWWSSVEYDVNCLIKVVSLPSHLDLFRFTGHQENSLKSACNRLAKKTLKEIAEAKEHGAAPEATGSNKPK